MEFKITLLIVQSFKEFHCEHFSELIFSVLHMHIIYTCITCIHTYIYIYMLPIIHTCIYYFFLIGIPKNVSGLAAVCL